jgi:hypothetical protein
MPNKSVIHTAGGLTFSKPYENGGLNRVQLLTEMKWLTVSRTGYGNVFIRPKQAVSMSVTITTKSKCPR